MTICPQGHDPGEAGLADGYCDVCGTRLTGTAGTGPPGAGVSVPAPHAPPAGTGAGSGSGAGAGAGAGQARECAACGAPVIGRFCEDCGHDQTAPVPDPAGELPRSASGPARALPNGPSAGPAARWEATVQADRDHYDRMIAQGGPDAGRIAFPPYCPRRDIPLADGEIRIGRTSRSRNLVPEIDLGDPPEDPGVSHLHAVLLPSPGGAWTLVDPGSANGTVVNGRQVGVNEPVPVDDGDRIHLGAWTLITLRRRRQA
ncbi:hypothetical protein GCM10010156_06520 [Planobispora rosea]|uniref:FHA domain-containing protein n=1 Tax=Planobispora rosea TaxID=35762 RepID=A0A8J3RWI5_PLARO|nr:FHA domain-containing protein [Planobispora rosea]GGS50490.1 hypothetical protein GCM10010156_06520 [Planobispora rosea]GIH82523.1 hypothetical protein Pro02_09310 [Planobispora rosea]